jgi:excinuclease UvrABC nuclease subunit
MAAMTFKVNFDGYWRERNINDIPSNSGIYCVYECTYNSQNDTVSIQRLIYIGEAGDVRDRIQNHEKWQDWKRYVRSGNELCFSYGYVESESRERVEAAFIFKHKPPANDEYKDEFPFDTTTINATGKTALLQTNFTVYRT